MKTINIKSLRLRLLQRVAGLLCVLAVPVFAQTPVILFQDGFENSATGGLPAPTDPTVGRYLVSGVGVTTNNSIKVLTGADVGGPDGAVVGNNYLRYDRGSLPNPVLQPLFGTPFYASGSPIHVSFYKWRRGTAGGPAMSVGFGDDEGSRVDDLWQLVYTMDWPDTLAWRYYNGSVYTDSGLAFTPDRWEFVEIDWDGANATGRIDGGAAVSLGIFGSADKLIDRLLFLSGFANSAYYLDDIKVTTTAPLLVRSIQPAPNSTVQILRPVVELQLVNATTAVQTGTIQLFFNDQAVSPVVTQTDHDGFTVTTINYLPATPLVYGSTNTVRCVYADDATPANEFTREWVFTVKDGDPVFADNFELATQLIVPSPNGLAFEGTNFLSISRIGDGRPQIVAAGAGAADVAGDVITLDFGVRATGGAASLFLRAGAVEAGQFNLFANGQVSVVTADSSANQFLTQQLILNSWNAVRIQFTNGSGIYNVSVNGGNFETKTGKVGNAHGFRLATAAAATACQFDAFVISNQTANTLLFKDGFETVAPGLLPTLNSPAVGTYPNVTPGSVAGGLLVQGSFDFVSQPPNAPQLGSYDLDGTTALVETGTGHGGAKFIDLYTGAARMEFITPIPAGIKVHAEAWIKWQAGNVSWGFLADGGNEFARLTLNDAYGITLFDDASEVDTGTGHTINIWEKYTLDYVVGADSITLSVNGYPATLPITPVSSLGGLFFFAPDDGTSRASVDDVTVLAELGNLPATSPVLAIAASGDQLILSWSDAAGYVLQENDDLEDPDNWVNVPAGGISPVAVPRAEGARFYRLTKPQ